MAEPQKAPFRRMPPRTRSNFLTRTATDAASQLDRRLSAMPQTPNQNTPSHSGLSDSPYEPRTEASAPLPRQHLFTKRVLKSLDGTADSPIPTRRSFNTREPSYSVHRNSMPGSQAQLGVDSKDRTGPRIGALPRPAGGSAKLGTFRYGILSKPRKVNRLGKCY